MMCYSSGVFSTGHASLLSRGRHIELKLDSGRQLLDWSRPTVVTSPCSATSKPRKFQDHRTRESRASNRRPATRSGPIRLFYLTRKLSNTPTAPPSRVLARTTGDSARSDPIRSYVAKEMMDMRSLCDTESDARRP